jgi:hypothetical protein
MTTYGSRVQKATKMQWIDCRDGREDMRIVSGRSGILYCLGGGNERLPRGHAREGRSWRLRENVQSVGLGEQEEDVLPMSLRPKQL